MAKHQNHEWDEAQNIVISTNLAEAMEGQKLIAKCKCPDMAIEGQNLDQGATKVIKEILAPKSSDLMFVEILMEIMEVTNVPVTHKGSLVLCVSKKQPGIMFGRRRRISICTEAEETQVVVLQCEPKGELLFELSSDSDSDLATDCSSTSFGTTSISLAELLKSVSKLTILKRLEFGLGNEPVMLSVAISTTPPTLSPYYALPMVGANAYVEETDGSAKDMSGMNARCLMSSVYEQNGDISSYGAECQGGGGGGDCGGKCHGGVGLTNLVLAGSYGAECGGGGGGDCGGAKCHGGSGLTIQV